MADIKQIRIAIIGIGRMGQLHAKTVQNHPDCELVGFLDKSQVAIDVALQLFPDTMEFLSIYEIEKTCDAVILATPASTHHEILSLLSNTKLHILCEKPCVNGFEQYQDIVNKFKNKPNIVKIGHCERFNPVVNELKSKIRFGGSKWPCTFIRKSNTRRNEDVSCIMDTMIHDIDLANYLFPNAGLPESVFVSSVGKEPSTNYIYSARIVLKFSNFKWVFDCDKRNQYETIRTVSYQTTTRIFETNLIKQTIDNSPVSPAKKDPLTTQLDCFLGSIDGHDNDLPTLATSSKTMYIAGLIEEAVKKFI